jgi:hypothetical protein
MTSVTLTHKKSRQGRDGRSQYLVTTIPALLVRFHRAGAPDVPHRSEAHRGEQTQGRHAAIVAPARNGGMRRVEDQNAQGVT